MSSYLIAATDFSDVASNAVHYACRLAQEIHTDVLIVHSFMIPISFGDNPMPVIPVDEGRDIAEERMEELLASLRATYLGLNLRGRISFGDIVESLDDITEGQKPAMIIIGNSGTDDKMLWMGSNVLGAMRNLRIPVLAVPNGYAYGSISNICYACDYKRVDKLLTDDLIRLSQLTNARLHILNVDYDNREFDPQSITEHHELFETLKAAAPEYHHIRHEKVEDAIYDFITGRQMDWLIVVPHKHSFWESLFHKSLTKAMIKTCPIPIAALHEQ